MVPRVSEKERLILELLIAQGELYGLQLVRASKGRLKRGTVYVTLGRMAEKGFVESREEKKVYMPGLPRRIFKATILAESVLRAWEAAELSWSRRMG